jgi:hypothetical protein
METTTPEQEQEVGIIGRMLRLFYVPSETFESLARKQSAADWLVPAILTAAVVVATAVLIMPITTEFTQQAMQQQMQDMPAEQRAIVEKSQGMMQTGALIATPIMMFIFLFIFAAVYLVLGKLLGGTLSYGQTLAISSYSMLVAIPQHIVKTPLILAKKTLLVQMGLGIFLSEETLQTFGGRFLASIDPFVIWGVVITGLGLSIVGQIDRNKAYIGVGIITLTWLAIASGLASLGQSFSPGS